MQQKTNVEKQKELRQKVRALIEENKRKEALELLTQAQLPFLEDDISALKSQHNKLLDDQSLGIVDDDAVRLETNKINNNFFRLLDKLERNDGAAALRVTSKRSFSNNTIALVVGGIAVFLFGFFLIKLMAEDEGDVSASGPNNIKDIKVEVDTVPALESININELESLVAYYPFDGNTKDQKGRYGATIEKNIKYNFNRGNQSDSAIYLKGDARLEFPRILNPVDNTFSIALWLKTSSSEGSIWGQFTKEDFNYIGQNHRFAISSGAIFYDNYPPSDSSRNHLKDGYPENEIVKDVWTHVVLTRNARKVKLYINGELIATNENAETYVNDGRGLVNHAMVGALIHSNGSDELSFEQYFTGSIDDLCIFDAPIELKTIKDLYKKKYQYQSN